MSAETEARGTTPQTTLADRIVDAVRHGSHVSHRARLATSMAKDAAEDGIHAAKRALKSAQRSVERLEDYTDDTARCVKRQPLTAVTITLASGLAIGFLCGWAIGRRRADVHP
jgi:ElaB/YqjD/DUF883 family membrane-anchored ribosome-binding protein